MIIIKENNLSVLEQMYPKLGVRIESIVNIKKIIRKKHECIEIEFILDSAMNFLKQKKFVFTNLIFNFVFK